MTGTPDPNYDLVAAIDTLLPGINVQREIVDAAYDAWAAGGFVPLTQATLLAGLASKPAGEPVPEGNAPTVQTPFPVTLPVFPTQLQRFPDSNPATDGWTTYTPAGAVLSL